MTGCPLPSDGGPLLGGLLGRGVQLGLELVDLVLPLHGELDDELLGVGAQQHVGRG